MKYINTLYLLFAFFLVGAQTMQHDFKETMTNINVSKSTINEAKHAMSAEIDIFFNSNNTSGKMDSIFFQSEYLEIVEELLNKCNDSDNFGQQLIALYPALVGTVDIRSLSKSLYPYEPFNSDKGDIRILLNNYTKSISNLDYSLAKTIWADSDEVSIINGSGQYFGFKSIFNDFMVKSFSELSDRQLSSVSEIINIYGDMAYIQFYWIFERKNKEGNILQSSGRETMICRKINNEWKINHIHYSGMPKGLI